MEKPGFKGMTTLFTLALAVLVQACASSPQPQKNEKTIQTLESEISKLEATVQELNQKVQELETRVTSDEPKQEKMAELPIEVKDTRSPVAKDSGTPVVPEASSPSTAGHPEKGFTQSPAVMSFRQAKILFDTGKDAEAILAFSAFLEENGDHPLAGSAQFYVGESYLRQADYSAAMAEFQKVLDHYGSSPRVSDALERLAFSEDKLSLEQEAIRHRDLLTALFPASPAAGRKSAPQPASVAPQKPSAPEELIPAPESFKDTEEKHSADLDGPPPTAPMAPTAPLFSKEDQQ